MLSGWEKQTHLSTFFLSFPEITIWDVAVEKLDSWKKIERKRKKWFMFVTALISIIRSLRVRGILWACVLLVVELCCASLASSV